MMGRYRGMSRTAGDPLAMRIRRLRRRRHSTALRQGLVYAAWSLALLAMLAVIAVYVALALRVG